MGTLTTCFAQVCVCQPGMASSSSFCLQEPPKHIPDYLPAFPDKHTYAPAHLGIVRNMHEIVGAECNAIIQRHNLRCKPRFVIRLHYS